MHNIKVAVLGLGTMGGAFATNLEKAGFLVSGYARSAQEGVPGRIRTVFSHAATAVLEAPIVLVALTDAQATNDVLLHPATLDAYAQQAIVVNMGTIGTAQTDALQSALARARPDLTFVDAPVAGSKGPAEAGLVTILASSDADVAAGFDSDSDSVPDRRPLRKQLAPVFETIGRRTVWLGKTGAGSAMKVVVNTWLVHVMQGIAETALLADRLGISTEALVDTLSGGPLDTPYAMAKLRKIDSGDWSTEMALSLGAKDARLAIDAGAGIAIPVTAFIADSWTEAAARDGGLGSADISSIYEILSAENAPRNRGGHATTASASSRRAVGPSPS